MKIKDKNIKAFDTVKVFREIKDKVSNEIQGMDFDQLTAYLSKTKLKPKS